MRVPQSDGHLQFPWLPSVLGGIAFLTSVHQISKVCHLHEVDPLYFLVSTAFGEQNTVSGITEHRALNSVVSLLVDVRRHGLFASIPLRCLVLVLFFMPTAWKPSQSQRNPKFRAIDLFFSFGGWREALQSSQGSRVYRLLAPCPRSSRFHTLCHGTSQALWLWAHLWDLLWPLAHQLTWQRQGLAKHVCKWACP